MISPDRGDPLLLLDRLSVNVEGRAALTGVTLSIMRGEIHAVVGGQGAGKSTLVKVIAGLIPKTGGRFLFDGRAVEKHSPGNALRLGILTVHQEPGLLPGLSAVENVFMNREIRTMLFFNDWRKMRKKMGEALRSIQLDVDMNRPLRFFDGPVQQLLEYAKLACFPSRLVVVDEPASRMGPEDLERLQYLLSVLRQNGATVLYVTNSTEEVFKFSSRVTIIDRGEVVETAEISNIDKKQLVQLTYASLFSRKNLEKSNLELFYLNNLNKNIINTIPIPVIVADSQGSIILVNRYLESIASLKQPDLLTTGIEDFLRLTPEQSRALRNDIDGRRRHEIHGWRLHTESGPVPVDLHVFPILDEDQSFIGTIYLVDVEESRNVFTAQMGIFDSYQKSRRAIWEVVHEVNNPLGIMLNYLTLIKSSSSVDEIHSSAEIMGRELKRVRRIFGRLAGSGEGSRREGHQASLRETVEEVLSLMKLDLNERIVLTIASTDDVLVPVEQDLLKQVILNIVLNGIEAMPEGGSLTIRVGREVRDGAGLAILAVSDTGIGIPPENLGRIFEPFFTTKSDTETRGLGLSLSKDILSRVGGFIEVASAAQGTTFTVYIPCADQHCTSV